MRFGEHGGAKLRLVLGVLALAAMPWLLSCQRDAPPPAVSAAPVAPPPAPPAPPDVSPPTQPTDLAVRVSPGRADLTWTRSGDDQGVEGYDVFRNEEKIARVADREAEDLGVRPGVRTCYSVVAFDAAGNRSAPSEPACAVAPDVTAPAAPGAIGARLLSPKEAELRWAAATDDVGVARYEVLRGEKVVATVEDTSWRTPAPAAGRRACFGVRAVDAAGNRSERSAEACVAGADVTPPSAPGALTARAKAGKVELSWSAARDDVGVARYEVLRDGAPVSLSSASPTATTAVDADVRASKRYCYTVRAFDAAKNGSPAAGPACAAVGDTTPPTVPAGLAARPQGTNGVALRWSAATDDVGVARYEVLRGSEVAARTEKLEATLRPFRAGIEHCLRVRACDAAGNCSLPSAPACLTLPDTEPPSQVALVTVAPGPEEGLTVHWTSAVDDVGVVEYEVKDGERAVRTNGRETVAYDWDLRPGTHHCYTVVAKDAAGNRSRPSQAACATTRDGTPPTVPPELVAAARSSSQVFVSWKAATDDVGVAGYEVLQNGGVVTRTSQLSAWLDDLSPDQEYCTSVRAVDAAGNRSPAAEPVCVRTAVAHAPSVPLNLSARAVPRGIELSWDPSPEPGVVYMVYRDKGASDVAIGMTAARRFQVAGAVAAQHRCYSVAAVDTERRSSPKTLPVCAAARAVGDAASPGTAATRVAGAPAP